MTVDELVDAVAQSKRASINAIVHESMPRDTLKAICAACGLDDSGREKASLVERILAAGGEANGVRYKIGPESTKGSRAAEGGAAPGAFLPGLDSVPAKKPTKGKSKSKKAARRRGGTDGDAAIAGTLKAALQQFALGAAGGYAGRDAHLAFTTHLLECFGWTDGRPDGAEIPRLFSIADAGQRVEREVALWWRERRTLIEVAAHDAVLDFAWKDLIRVCLQLDPIPQYVVLTNQRDLHLYDLARDREAPRLAIRIDDLPKYSEAFPFFTKEWTPGAVPKIVNVEKVSEEVADLVARLYRSVRAAHPTRQRDVIRFTLQCITAMFAEDIGLLPKNYFTTLLYNGAKASDVEHRLHQLFTQMNTPDLPAPRVVPYFNGGLFTDVTT
ncbi:MAG: SAP domain-containing protein, partial [Kofleriaceae bacterium]